LDNFQIKIGNTKPTKELVKKELFIFWHYKWIWRRSNVPYEGGRNMKLEGDTW
jgi:hypothetical protein